MLKKHVHELEIELPVDLKEIPTKLDDITKNVTSLASQVAELKTLQWELPAEFISLPTQVASVQAKLKTLDALPSLLLNQADTMPAEGEKNTNQATISHLFQKRDEKENLNNQQPKPTTPPATTIIPPVITTTTTQIQSPSLQPPKSSSQPEGEHIKEDKGKKALSLEEAEKESTDSNSDDETYVTGSMVEPSKTKKLNKFDFITKDGRHIYLTEEEINHQKKLGEDAKSEDTKQEGEGSVTLKVYREDGISEIIPNFKASTRMDYIHTTEAELGINLDIPLSKQIGTIIDKLNDLANKKRKHADDIHDYFKANKRLKRHQGPGLDDPCQRPSAPSACRN
ncbi:hypothetical protein Tco_1318736 [Tanacetum coccineum]